LIPSPHLFLTIIEVWFSDSLMSTN
jgi:hypothetical protein